MNDVARLAKINAVIAGWKQFTHFWSREHAAKRATEAVAWAKERQRVASQTGRIFATQFTSYSIIGLQVVIPLGRKAVIHWLVLKLPWDFGAEQGRNTEGDMAVPLLQNIRMGVAATVTCVGKSIFLHGRSDRDSARVVILATQG